MDANKKITIKILLMLTLIVGAAFTIRILCYSGYVGSDDHAYSKMAYYTAKGTFKFGGSYPHAPVVPLRVGLFTPVALCIKIAGFNEKTITFTLSLFPLSA